MKNSIENVCRILMVCAIVPLAQTAVFALGSVIGVDSVATQHLNLPYGDAPGKSNLLDLYLPKGNSPSTKLVMYIHGGSWSRGSKEQFPKPVIDLLVGKMGYAVATMNYRLVTIDGNRFPSQIEDISKAVAFLSENAAVYGYNGNELALVGGSAGAHLAMLYAYGHDPAKRVKTVVDLFGPVDLADLMIKKGSDPTSSTVRLLGVSDSRAKIVLDASPIFHLTAKSAVPTIIFHGEADELVPVEQSKMLYRKLQSLSIPAQLELYPGEDHEIKGKIKDVFSKMMEWLGKWYPPAK